MCLAHAQEGLANVCLVGSSTTILKAKVEANLPRKRGAAAAGYDKALESFFSKVSHGYRSDVWLLLQFTWGTVLCQVQWAVFSLPHRCYFAM